ncbi:MAG: DMT family transporter [Deltaproteobacteria bacterium]|jgi:drug/metabolite transporter (DMT)-like permease|nr:DMT family transporter [Deltaproteobacteria bacterium]
MKVWRADLNILLASSLWGLTYIFGRWALDDCAPALFIFLRIGLAALVSWPFIHKSVKKTTPKVRREGLILGLLTGTGYILQVYSLNFTTVARSAFLTGMCLIGIPILSFILFRQVIKKNSLVGVILAVIGLYIFLDPSFAGVNVGDIIGIIGIPVWALYMIYMSVFTEGKTDPDETNQYLFWQLIGVLPLALLTVLIFESGFVLAPLHPDLAKGLTLTPTFLIGLAFAAVMGTLIPVFLQTRSQRYTTAVQAMICFQFEPVTAAIASFVILHEPMTANTLVGGLIIIMAVLISEIGGILADKRASQTS